MYIKVVVLYFYLFIIRTKILYTCLFCYRSWVVNAVNFDMYEHKMTSRDDWNAKWSSMLIKLIFVILKPVALRERRWRSWKSWRRRDTRWTRLEDVVIRDWHKKSWKTGFWSISFIWETLISYHSFQLFPGV